MTDTAVLERDAQSAVEQESLNIRGAAPVERLAILVRHDPLLQPHQPEQARDTLQQIWDNWKPVYLSALADLWHLSASDLYTKEDEAVRLRFDGKTPMIDLPSVRTTANANTQFDLRHCVALCLDTFSSKVWTRIGFPEGQWCATDEVRKVTNLFRQRAAACTEWFYNEFFTLTSNIFEGNARTRSGFLEVTVVGLKAEEDSGDVANDRFESWLLHKDRPNLDNERLRAFIAAAGDFDFDVRDLPQKEPDAFWMSLPMAVRLASGDIESRLALFLARPLGNRLTVVGVALDDSAVGDLASLVALKLSRFIANRG